MSSLTSQNGVYPTIESPSNTTSKPSPDLFSFIPEIYRTISRLSVLRNPAPNTASGENQDHPLSTTLSRESRASNGTTLDTANTIIEAKDLPAYLYGVRQRITKAKEIVKEIPDVARTVEEQQAEIRLLEGRVQALKTRSQELSTIAAVGVGEMDVMPGVEQG